MFAILFSSSVTRLSRALNRFSELRLSVRILAENMELTAMMATIMTAAVQIFIMGFPHQRYGFGRLHILCEPG